MTIVAVVVMLVGAAFCLLASVGMLRFPDLFTRAHAASKAGVLGVGLTLAGVALASEDLSMAATVAVGIVFAVMAGPVTAHLLTRAALKSGVAPVPSTNIEK